MEIAKAYFSVPEILTRWRMPESDLIYLAENDELRLSVRVFDQPLMFTTTGGAVKGKSRRRIKRRNLYTGLLDLRAGDAFELFRCGEIHLIEFRLPQKGCVSIHYRDQPLFLMIGDLLVRREERDRFEAANSHTGKGMCADREGFSASPNYQHICCNGRHFRLGAIQAEVVRCLHQALIDGNPWEVGKVILSASGSRSLRMSDVFKSQPHWRELILSDKRGKYRLNYG